MKAIAFIVVFALATAGVIIVFGQGPYFSVTLEVAKRELPLSAWVYFGLLVLLAMTMRCLLGAARRLSEDDSKKLEYSAGR